MPGSTCAMNDLKIILSPTGNAMRYIRLDASLSVRLLWGFTKSVHLLACCCYEISKADLGSIVGSYRHSHRSATRRL